MIDINTIHPLPEFIAARATLEDILFRSQQLLIAVDRYESSLIYISTTFPDMLTIGDKTKDLNMSWSSGLTARELCELQNRCKQFVIISSLNTAAYLLDDYTRHVLKKYWNAVSYTDENGKEDLSWYAPHTFEALTGTKSTSFKYYKEMDELHRLSENHRLLTSPRSVTPRDFYDILSKVGYHMQEINHIACVKYHEEMKDNGKEGKGDTER